MGPARIELRAIGNAQEILAIAFVPSAPVELFPVQRRLSLVVSGKWRAGDGVRRLSIN